MVLVTCRPPQLQGGTVPGEYHPADVAKTGVEGERQRADLGGQHIQFGAVSRGRWHDDGISFHGQAQFRQRFAEPDDVAMDPLHRLHGDGRAVFAERIGNRTEATHVCPYASMVAGGIPLRKGGHWGSLPDVRLALQDPGEKGKVTPPRPAARPGLGSRGWRILVESFNELAACEMRARADERDPACWWLLVLLEVVGYEGQGYGWLPPDSPLSPGSPHFWLTQAVITVILVLLAFWATAVSGDLRWAVAVGVFAIADQFSQPQLPWIAIPQQAFGHLLLTSCTAVGGLLLAMRLIARRARSRMG